MPRQAPYMQFSSASSSRLRIYGNNEYLRYLSSLHDAQKLSNYLLYSLASFSQDAECRLVAMMSEHSVMGFGRKAKIPVVQETTMDTDGIGGDDIVTPPGK